MEGNPPHLRVVGDDTDRRADGQKNVCVYVCVCWRNFLVLFPKKLWPDDDCAC